VRVEAQRRIRASQQRVFQLLSRVEGLPRYADLWLAADVLERSGGQVVVEFRGYFGGLPVDSVQRVSLRPPARLEFRQLRGTLKGLRAEYIVEAEGEGSRLTVRMEVDAGIALLPDQVVRSVVTAALARLVGKVKDAAERDLPRLLPRRPTAPAVSQAADLGTAEPEPPGEESPVETAPVTSTAGPSPEVRTPPGRRRRRRRHRRKSPRPPAGPGTAPAD
jgi:uncharacterized protein YndB with AHSA1/START domain